MKIKSFVFNPFYENTYVLWDDRMEGVIIDPGCYESYEKEELTDFIKKTGILIKAIVNTHCHIDHVLGNYDMKLAFGCPLWLPEGELEIFRAVKAYAPQWGIHQYSESEPDRLLKEEDHIEFGETTLECISVPGHSPGHLVFYHSGEKKLIGGDVLFRESIGRTDLPGGNHAQLLKNIQTKVYTLPEETEVFPGHGPSTTVGYEKANNPFIKGA
ncbi:MBL fold metallo-hydrolase [Marinoscillum sp. 108]|uniref:MBL fold metallo-hydrolase n=1 Tax=Marinoscillum sp. 108 TaxID=2653151 RepID=UPI0012EF532C|nr:MBL fold metallo-hydrolase [Marinoscillum sp. 108]VXD19310.1 Glyoxylase-like metal-dependent hydrolase (Beta-lactamase superfamily II) [Marinoscillum sp. 108]